MSKKGLVSVIVPVYNVELWLRECLDSIAVQTYENMEVIVVDDGSTDSSGRICDEYAAKFPGQFKSIHKTNGGLSSARNRGIDEAQGEYVCFVDSDDWIAPTLIEHTVHACVKYQADIVCFGIIYVYPKRSVMVDLPLKECVLSPQEAFGKLLRGRECTVSACNKLFRVELFQSIRFPEGELYEDAAIMFRLFDHARKIALLPECMYYYRRREESIMTSAFNEKKWVLIRYAAETLKLTEEKYPDLLPDARRYYAMRQIEILSRLQLLSSADRARYRKAETKYKKELCKLCAFLPDYKWRIRCLLVMTNTYGFFWKLYYRLLRRDLGLHV